MVKNSESPNGIASHPAPFVICPKRVTTDTIDQSSHV